jgi:hypothetical protein
MKRALLCGVAALTLAAGASAEGYVSGNYTDIDGTDTWSLNGRYLLGNHVLLDGGYTNIDGDGDVWNIGGHLFAREANWLLGAYAGYLSADGGESTDQFTVAGEGQYYLERVTLGLTITYSDLDVPLVEPSMWSVAGDFRYFVTDNFSVQVGAAWVSFDTVIGDQDGHYIDVGAEYQFDASPFAVFAGYRHTDIGVETDTWGIGLRWNFGEGSLIQRDRSGARLRRPEGVLETGAGGLSLD